MRRRRIVINSELGFFDFSRNVWNQEGVRGFFRGASIVPIQCVTWSMALLIFDTAGLTFETAVDV